MDKKRVLIVDDEEVNRRLLSSFFTFQHFTVETAPDGLAALKMTDATAYDLIFSDIEMPNMTGLEFLSRIKRNPAKSAIPFVMLTTLDNRETIDKAKSLGASEYMVKPFKRDNMVAILKKLGFSVD